MVDGKFLLEDVGSDCTCGNDCGKHVFDPNTWSVNFVDSFDSAFCESSVLVVEIVLV